MTVNASFPGKPWQNTLVGSRNKLNALFNDGYISDLTITFPGKGIRYKAHKVILAMSSSVFEGMLFGPMAITGSELELADDNPEAFKIVLAHCYDVSMLPSDIDEALEVYMLADKYFLEQLSIECSHYICSMINSENIEKMLEFSTSFTFDSLKEACYEHIMDSPQVLLVLRQEWLKKLLESYIDFSELVFEESWQYPVETLQEDNILQILKSENCRNRGLRKFSGCVSAKVVRNICWADFEETGDSCKLCLSFTNLQQANEILSLLDNIKYTDWLCIHLQCKMIPADRLGKIPTLPYPLYNRTKLFLSNVDDNGIDWAVSAICSLKPLDKSFEVISFPRSKLTLSGFKILLKRIEIVCGDVTYPIILMCSSNIRSTRDYELDEWIKLNFKLKDMMYIKLYDKNEDIEDWYKNKTLY